MTESSAAKKRRLEQQRQQFNTRVQAVGTELPNPEYEDEDDEIPETSSQVAVLMKSPKAPPNVDMLRQNIWPFLNTAKKMLFLQLGNGISNKDKCKMKHIKRMTMFVLCETNVPSLYIEIQRYRLLFPIDGTGKITEPEYRSALMGSVSTWFNNCIKAFYSRMVELMCKLPPKIYLHQLAMHLEQSPQPYWDATRFPNDEACVSALFISIILIAGYMHKSAGFSKRVNT